MYIQNFLFNFTINNKGENYKKFLLTGLSILLLFTNITPAMANDLLPKDLHTFKDGSTKPIPNTAEGTSERRRDTNFFKAISKDITKFTGQVPSFLLLYGKVNHFSGYCEIVIDTIREEINKDAIMQYIIGNINEINKKRKGISLYDMDTNFGYTPIDKKIRDKEYKITKEIAKDFKEYLKDTNDNFDCLFNIKYDKQFKDMLLYLGENSKSLTLESIQEKYSELNKRIPDTVKFMYKHRKVFKEVKKEDENRNGKKDSIGTMCGTFSEIPTRPLFNAKLSKAELQAILEHNDRQVGFFLYTDKHIEENYSDYTYNYTYNVNDFTNNYYKLLEKYTKKGKSKNKETKNNKNKDNKIIKKNTKMKK